MSSNLGNTVTVHKACHTCDGFLVSRACSTCIDYSNWGCDLFVKELALGRGPHNGIPNQCIGADSTDHSLINLSDLQKNTDDVVESCETIDELLSTVSPIQLNSKINDPKLHKEEPEHPIGNPVLLDKCFGVEVDCSQPTSGKKFDNGKPDWTLMPWRELEQVLEILEFGAKKYSRDNWQHVEPDRYKKAAMRHMVSYLKGDLVDEESGKPHLAHLMCNILFLMWNDNEDE